MSIKPEFERQAETPDKKLDRLDARAQAIDDMLRTGSAPQPKLQPKGMARVGGNKLGRAALKQQRVDIRKEIDEIQKSRSPIGPKQDLSRGL